MTKIKLIKFIILLLSSLLLGQTSPKELSSARQQLQKIQTEINQLEKKLGETEKKLNWQIKSSENLEKQITLVQKSMRIIKNEIGKKNRNISTLEIQLDTLQHQISALQDIFGKQILFAYKYQRGKELQWILGSENLNQAFTRYRNFQKIAVQARSYYEKLRDKQNEKLKLLQELQAEISEKQKLATRKEKEQLALNSKRKQREKLIANIKSDKNLMSRALEQKKKNYQELLKLIASLEAQKQNRKLEPQTQIRWEKLSGNFHKFKGKLNWPVSGKVIHSFGKYKNPELKTVLKNTGIDIRAKRGTNVRCVFPGVVSLITYMSGFGNTVIVDHNNGYYTVYTHLDEVVVNKFEFLEAGETIGLVGDSGSLEGALLHFEIYGGNKPLNPTKWLKKM